MSFFFGFLDKFLAGIILLSDTFNVFYIKRNESEDNCDKKDYIRVGLSWILYFVIYNLVPFKGKIYFYLLFKIIFLSKKKEFITLNYHKEPISCLKTLADGRLAAGDLGSTLIIYDKETFNPDIIINNRLGDLLNFTQIKNKNIICSFRRNYEDIILKIIKIKSKKEYENVQIISNPHKEPISNIIELKNESIITFSFDHSFQIWKLNDNQYEKIDEFEDIYQISDGLETKDNEEILYSLIVFHNH